jgi:hypothetical protein
LRGLHATPVAKRIPATIPLSRQKRAQA